jgi:hypothetical protein
MSKFSSEYRYPGFVWLATRGQRWVARDRISPALLDPHDTSLAALDVDPQDMTVAVAWMDARNAIYQKVDPILDGPALQRSLDAELRKRGEERALDAMLSPRRTPRP